MSLESSTQSDFELAEALNELAEELKHADKEMATVRAARSNIAEKPKQLSAKRELVPTGPSLFQIARIIKELRQKEIKDRLSAREKALKISKTVELIMALVRERTGKYGKITEEMKSWAVEYAQELTAPNTTLAPNDTEGNLSFKDELNSSESGRIVAAAEAFIDGIINRSNSLKEGYRFEIEKTLAHDIGEDIETIRSWITEAITMVKKQREESGRLYAKYGEQTPDKIEQEERPLVGVN